MVRLLIQVISCAHMLLYSVLLLVGFLILFKSADQFVIGAIATAKNLDISPMIIGLTVVALGTSAPEIFVAATSSLNGEPELAIGNAIGSNIANMGMVLGITAMLVPLPYRPEVLKHDLPVMIFVTFCAGFALIDMKLTPIDGLLLLSGLVLFLYRVARSEKNSAEVPFTEKNSDISCDSHCEIDAVEDMSMRRAIAYLVFGLIFLLIGSKLLVYAVIAIAQANGISELIIGLTVIAVGTSLPELVVSVTSARKGETDLALGNIFGSNIFNILAVLAVPSLLAPTVITEELLYRDYGLMLAMTLGLAAFAYGMRSKPAITRGMGIILLTTWACYMFTLYHQAH